METAYIALGSNLGKREENISLALSSLEEKGISIVKTATIIETDPVGGPPQNRYLNSVIKIKTLLSPLKLLKICLKIEKKLGRERIIKNAPRTIDLDLLIYDNITLDTEELILPHPRMLERDFVMKPLLEIEPDILEKFKNQNGEQLKNEDIYSH